MDSTLKLTNLIVSASSDVTEVSGRYLNRSWTADFVEGTADIDVSDMLGNLDKDGDGVSIEKTRSYRLSTFTVVIENTDGDTASVSIKLKV